MRNWHKFRRLPQQEKRLLVEASVLLPLTAVAIRMIGFRRWKSVLLKVSRIIESNSAIKDKHGFLKALHTSDLVKIAAWHGLYQGNCLEQSLVLWCLLGRQGIKSDLRFGARKEASQLEAHAWVEFEGQPLNDSPDVDMRFKPFERAVVAEEGNS